MQRFTDTDACDSENSLIIGSCPEMLRIKRSIPELNRLNEPVLIQGEPGTGKELIARAIHYQSERRTSPFVKINLVELNSGQLDEVLFGAGPGGFMDSNQPYEGAYHPAGGGTLLLDEIATLPASMQSRLLAVFENGFPPPNQAAKENADLKILVSSSKFLDQLVKKGKFREDLYYRINAVTIEIPPLRNRIGDIPLLADFFADQFCMEHGVGRIELPKRLKDSFCRYSWPGNVRELKTIVRKTILYANGDSIIENSAAHWEKSPDVIDSDQDIYTMVGLSNLKNYLKKHSNLSLKNVRRVYLLRTEKKIIKKALEKTNWNRKKAAELLEISYKSLLNKVKEYGLA
jgi:DNA-binding NtrC family response regulator